jgi:hypothetical protein
MTLPPVGRQDAAARGDRPRAMVRAQSSDSSKANYQSFKTDHHQLCDEYL